MVIVALHFLLPLVWSFVLFPPPVFVLLEEKKTNLMNVRFHDEFPHYYIGFFHSFVCGLSRLLGSSEIGKQSR